MFTPRLVLSCLAVTTLLALGCAGGGGTPNRFGSPFTFLPGGGGTTGPGNSGVNPGGALAGNDRSNVDPCTLPQNERFIRISMRNNNPDDFIHYFVAFVAFVNDPAGANGFVDGAVCPTDTALYRANGYTREIPAGGQQQFGNYCIQGPALIYFYENGAFRQTGGMGNASLASAIGPASGAVPTFDSFFTAAGAQIPVPNLIIWHNPGTGSGASLLTTPISSDPCNPATGSGLANCSRDAFYYVDEFDLLAGTPTRGAGSGRREPNEIQDTACLSGSPDEGWHQLAPAGVSAANALDFEFLRGGRIEYVFIRDDLDPPVPQLVWEVTDARNVVAHTFDPATGVQ